MYKIIKGINTYTIKNDNIYFPLDKMNSDYIRMIEKLSFEEDTIEGADIVSKDYVELRQDNYPPLQEQLDKIFHEGIDAWKADIQAIKDAYPKTLEQTTTSEGILQSILDDVAEFTFNRQLEEYGKAVSRLAQYRKSEGVPEETLEIVSVTETLNEDGTNAYHIDETANTVIDFSDSNMITTQEVTTKTIPGIEALPLKITTLDDNLQEVEVDNPEVVIDEAQRTRAQDIIDVTPQAVIDAYNEQ